MAAPVRPEALSIQAAAVLLSVSEKTIRRRIKDGDIEAVRVGPRLWRIPKDVIAKLRSASGRDRSGQK